MAASELQLPGTLTSAGAGRTRNKPRDSTGTQESPLVIRIRGAGSGQPGSSGATAAAGPSNAQQQDRPAEAGTSRQRRQQAPPAAAAAAAVATRQQQNDVIVIESDDDSSDEEVVITGYKPGRKRPRASPAQPQQQQAQQQQGRQVERGLHGGYFVMPSWEQQQQPAPAAAAEPPPRPASPEPAFKCLICLEGIKSDNMGTTPCGHIFCYNCIVEAIKATRKCPKCRKTTAIKSVKRLYPN